VPISMNCRASLGTRISKLLQHFEGRLGHLNTFTREVTLAWEPHGGRSYLIVDQRTGDPRSTSRHPSRWSTQSSLGAFLRTGT